MEAPPGEAASLGVALSINPVNECVSVMLTFENTEGEIVAWTMLDPSVAGKIAISLMAQAHDAYHAQQEIDSTPMDDRPQTVERVVQRLTAGSN